MGWQLTHSFEEYVRAAEPVLRQRPAQHTVMLTVIENLRAGARTDARAPLFGWWTEEGGTVRGACSHTPPYHLVLTELPAAAIEPLARALHEGQWPLPGVLGFPAVARDFAAAWSKLTGEAPHVHREERLYRLRRLLPPDPAPPGKSRLAGQEHRDLLIRWLGDFAREAGSIAPSDTAAVVDDRLSYGAFLLWERGGEPVAFMGRSRSAAGVSRIGPVYTPVQHRRQGYGAAVTASGSRAALEAGAGEVVLFTDLANPTSNAIYQRIGFEPAGDQLSLSFGPDPQ